MNKKFLIVTLPLLSLLIVSFVVQGATITTCTFDKDTYHQGETGYMSATIYNDKDNKIRVTELTATINYHYTDGNVYLQKFFTETTLPAEIQQGQSSNFDIPFSLPTNIESGYTSVDVKAKTEIWNVPGERWLPSEHPTSQPTLYIESPYKQQSQGQLMMIYVLGATTIVFAAVTAFLFVLKRRAGLITPPVA